MDYGKADFLCGKLFQRILECLCRTLKISLDDNLEFLNFAVGNVCVKGFCICPSNSLCCFKALEFLSLCSKVTGIALAFCNLEWVSCIRHGLNTKHFDWHGRSCFLYLLTLVVKDCPYTTRVDSCNERIACTEGSALYDNCSNYTASLVDAAFDNLTFCAAVILGLKLKDFCLDKNCVKKVVYTLSLEGRNIYILSVATPCFRCKAVL